MGSENKCKCKKTVIYLDTDKRDLPPVVIPKYLIKSILRIGLSTGSDYWKKLKYSKYLNELK